MRASISMWPFLSHTHTLFQLFLIKFTSTVCFLAQIICVCHMCFSTTICAQISNIYNTALESLFKIKSSNQLRNYLWRFCFWWKNLNDEWKFNSTTLSHRQLNVNDDVDGAMVFSAKKCMPHHFGWPFSDNYYRHSERATKQLWLHQKKQKKIFRLYSR